MVVQIFMRVNTVLALQIQSDPAMAPYQCILQLLLLLPLMACTNDSVLCEPGEEGDCSKCYVVLAEQVTKHDRNFFEIQKAFFPPDTRSPVFVIVTYTYYYEGENSTLVTDATEIWFWSTSTFYLYQPLHVFQFTSLFFSDTQLEISEVRLTLPMECYNASEDHKQLLTQRVSYEYRSNRGEHPPPPLFG